MNDHDERGFRGLEETMLALEDVGFKIYKDHFAREMNKCNWQAIRRTKMDAVECETNEGKAVQLVVTPFLYEIQGTPRSSSIEVDLTAEAGGVWYELKAYALSTECIVQKIPQIEKSLVSAWNSLLRDKTE